jgi:hypothetical protein
MPFYAVYPNAKFIPMPFYAVYPNAKLTNFKWFQMQVQK